MAASRGTFFTKNALGDFIGTEKDQCFAGEETFAGSAFSTELNYITKNVEPVPKIRPTNVLDDDRAPVTYENGTFGLNRRAFGYWLKGNLTDPATSGGLVGATISQTLWDSKEYLKYGVCFMVCIDYYTTGGGDTWFPIVEKDTVTRFDWISTGNNISNGVEKVGFASNGGANFRGEDTFDLFYYASVTPTFPFSQYVKECAPFGVNNISCADLLDVNEIFDPIFQPAGGASTLGFSNLNDSYTATPGPTEVRMTDQTTGEVNTDTIRFVRIEYWRLQGEDNE